MSLQEITQELVKRAKAHELGFDVGPSGTASAACAIVGEAPGEREVVMKTPLVGGAGKMLWDSLRPHGIVRHHLYVTNVCKRQISLSTQEANLKNPLSKRHEALWRDILLWELGQLVNLTTIVVCGSMALKALLGLDGINKWRGSVIKRQMFNREITFVIVNNPAAALHSPSEEVIFKFHCAKINQVLQNKFVEHKIDAYINPTYKDSVDYLKELIELCQKQKGCLPISFDIETLGYETACIGIAASSHSGICVPFYKTEWSLPQEKNIRVLLNTLLQTNRLIAQNGMFDCSFLWFRDRLRTAPLWFDTLLAHHTLYPKLPHNLGFLTTQYTNHPYYKDEKDTWRDTGDVNMFWEYNVKDCAITYAIHKRLLSELTEQAMSTFFFDHVMRAQPHLVTMTVGGVLIDVGYKHNIIAMLQEDLLKYKEEFDSLVRECTGKDILYNPQSPKQMKDLYYRQLKLVGRGTSTDKAARDAMVKHPATSDRERELINSHAKFVAEAKFLSTYAEAAIDKDARMRSEYKQFGTQKAPGRLSSSGNGWNTGGNLQNQPQRAYPMFIADPGFCFVYFDASQAEARIVAYRASIHSWIEQFERARIDGSYDCHRALASEMFDIKYDDVPKEDRLEDGSPTVRFIAKRCRHGLNYRMQFEKLAETTGLTINRAREAYVKYHRISPELKVWWDIQVNDFLRTKRIFNAFGRRMLLMEKPNDDALDSIIAFYPQSTLGDKIVRTMYECHDDPTWPKDARIALNVHDALIALCRVDDAQKVATIMKRHAESPIPIESIVDGKTRDLIIPAEIKISKPDDVGIHRWSTLEKVKL